MDRIIYKISPEPNSGCWLWLGYVGPNGYAHIKHNGHVRGAHRVLYELTKGPVPEGLELDHLCRVRCCVNPQHLEPVTARENGRRGDAGKWQQAKTHCAHGHEYDAPNTYMYKGRHRVCRKCNALAAKRWKSKQE